ncbi:MAG: hypothetical protein LBQ50_14715 [Planctomycetaceae bacterium]|nr:hypothetical protein [Planctomycetaceae bacterium]
MSDSICEHKSDAFQVAMLHTKILPSNFIYWTKIQQRIPTWRRFIENISWIEKFVFR